MDIDLDEFGVAALALDDEINAARVAKGEGRKDMETWVVCVPVGCAEWRNIRVLLAYRINVGDETAFMSSGCSFIGDISRIEKIAETKDVDDDDGFEVVEEEEVVGFVDVDSPFPLPSDVAAAHLTLPPSPGPENSTTPSINITLYISIEKAMNLPLVSDPLGSTFPSPFVKKSDSFTSTLPNACVTLSPPLKSLYDPLEIRSGVVYNQTNPVWNLQACLPLTLSHRQQSQLRDVRRAAFKFKVWHTPHEEGDESAEQVELLGTCVVGLDPLFTGMTEIHGWYPIHDSEGINKGQLMVRICPAQDFGALFKDWAQDEEEAGVVYEASGMSRSIGDNWKPSFILGGAEVSLKPVVDEKPQETFVWNGKQWEQKKIISHSSDSKPITASIFEKSISETIHDLDLLKRSMMSKLQKLNSSSPESKYTQSREPERRDTGTDAAVLAMTLPVDTSLGFPSTVSEVSSEVGADEELAHNDRVDRIDSSNPFKDDTMNDSKIAFELNHYENVALKAAADFSASISDTNDPAIVRTNDLMEKLDILQLQDPSFLSDSILSTEDVPSSPTRQQVKSMLQLMTSSRQPGGEAVEYSKPPLPPSIIPAAPLKWKELDRIQPPLSANTVPSESNTHRATGEASTMALMQQRLGNVSLESSTRIANVLRSSLNSL